MEPYCENYQQQRLSKSSELKLSSPSLSSVNASAMSSPSSSNTLSEASPSNNFSGKEEQSQAGTHQDQKADQKQAKKRDEQAEEDWHLEQAPLSTQQDTTKPGSASTQLYELFAVVIHQGNFILHLTAMQKRVSQPYSRRRSVWRALSCLYSRNER